MTDIDISDGQLSLAALGLVDAANTMAEHGVGRGGSEFSSMTGIKGEIDDYLNGIQVARAALADASKSGSQAITVLLHESAEVDARIAQSLYSGYAVARAA